MRSECSDLTEDLAYRELEAVLLQAIQLLPAKERLILQLHFYENLRPQDIAGILKMSVNAPEKNCQKSFRTSNSV
jgi:DNA-directed RNA polymerase specialized sigma24 family protein